MWSWFKKKFNIGGVKVKIELVDQHPVIEPEGVLTGKARWTCPYAAGTVWATGKLVCETTTGSGEGKKKTTTVIGQTKGEQTDNDYVYLDGEHDFIQYFAIPYDFRNWFEKKGGVLGAASKIGSFIAKATAEESSYDEYYIEIGGEVAGVWTGPSDRKRIEVAINK